MKKFAIAVVAFLGLGAAVQAGEVSSQLLGKMGMGGMQQLSDAQGMEIRGQGQSIRAGGDIRTTNTNTVKNSFNVQTNQNGGTNVDGDVRNTTTFEDNVDIDDSFNTIKVKVKISKSHRRNRRN